jgi:nucleoside-diphosphate-sugar epimerase
MKVFVAGASGALGKQLVPKLVTAGHDVVGMARRPESAELVRELGAEPVIADALDAEEVGSTVADARPEVIVHQLTAIPDSLNMRHFDREFAATNRLRTEGTDNLLAAGRAIGVRRFVAQSFAAWPYAREGGPVKTEEDPLDQNPIEAVRSTTDAIRYLERAVVGAEWTEGIALRYGGFYGPGTGLSADSEMAGLILKRRLPIVGNGAGVWSFIHIEDAADATLAAIERGGRGIYNIADDEPARAAEWLPAVSRSLGLKPPRRIPRWLARLLAGEAVVVMMTDIRGASNAKAKQQLGWQPAHPSWRQGLVEALG